MYFKTSLSKHIRAEAIFSWFSLGMGKQNLLRMLSILQFQAIRSANNYDKVSAIFHLIQKHNESHNAPVSPLWAS